MAALTDTKIRSLKPRPKLYRVADMDGLCIEVRPTGARAWRYRYRFLGKANMLHLGDYPAMSLQDARRERDRQRELLAQGIDPSDARRQARVLAQVAADDSFEGVAREWMRTQGKWSDSTREKAAWLFETYAFPWIGKRPIGSITTPEMLVLLRRPESLGKLETTQRLKQRCGQVFRYGIGTGRCDRDPTADLRGVLTTAHVQHYASVTHKPAVGQLMRDIDGFTGQLVTKCALRLPARVELAATGQDLERVGRAVQRAVAPPTGIDEGRRSVAVAGHSEGFRAWQSGHPLWNWKRFRCRSQ